MPIRRFEDRLTQQDYIDIQKWDKILKNDDKSYENARRRDRYHNLGSLDENISIEGRNTDLYELIADTNPDGEEVYLQNEMMAIIINFIEDLNPKDKIIMISKLTEKPLPSTKLANLLGISDKTVTTHFKKYQKMLQQQLKDYD